MKQCREWCLESGCVGACDITASCIECKQLKAMGWRAALEWVAKRGMHHYGNDFLTDMSELSTEIRIELGMLDENGKVVK